MGKDTSEDHDISYIESILYGPEDIPIHPKELRNNGYVKPFHKRFLDLENELISYYDTPHTARVRKLRLRVVPVKFI